MADTESGRQRAKEFVAFAAAALGGASYADAKDVFQVSSHQAETRKSLFEEMGLLYVPARSNQVVVTPVGRQLYDLLAPGTPLDAQRQNRVNAVIAWALSNTQMNRPQSRGSPSPTPQQWQACDIRPYAAAWRAILELDGWLKVDEFFGVLWFCHTVTDLAPAIADIKAARQSGKRFIDPDRFAKDGDLMNPRIYWVSHLSAGGTILQVDEDNDRLLMPSSSRELVETVLRFVGGCAMGVGDASVRARPYRSVEEYFEQIGGRACPDFLFSGSMRVENVGSEPITVLTGYQPSREGRAVVLEGGPELCSISLDAPCYHREFPERLFRLAVKEESADYKVRLKLLPGRPFSGSF